MKRGFLAFLLLLGLVSTATAQSRFWQKDWSLVCDNTRTCRAIGYDASQRYVPVVVITRLAGSEQKPTIHYLYDGLCGSVEAPCPKNATLRIGGKSFGEISLSAKNGAGQLSDTQASELLFVFAGQRSVKVEFTMPKPVIARDEESICCLSLNGARAVLLKMDQFQKRENTVGAIVKKGDLGEEDVLQGVPMPVVQAVKTGATRALDAKLGKQILASLKKPAKRECDELTSPVRHNEDGSVITEMYRLTNSKVLLSLRCWSGTKNSGYGFWVANDKAPYNPILVTPNGDPVDEKRFSGQISSTNIGHGSTGNVYLEAWTWNGQRFVHTESKETLRFRNEYPWVIPSVVAKVLPPEKSNQESK
jgi:Protein of unknown function (DUF1176)